MGQPEIIALQHGHVLSYVSRDTTDLPVTSLEDVERTAAEEAQRIMDLADREAKAKANTDKLHEKLAKITLPFEIFLVSIASDAEVVRSAQLSQPTRSRWRRSHSKANEEVVSPQYTHESYFIASDGQTYPYRIGWHTKGMGESKISLPDFYEQRLQPGTTIPEEPDYGKDSDWLRINCKDNKISGVGLKLPRSSSKSSLLQREEVAPLVSLWNRLLIPSSLRLDLSFSSLQDVPQLDMRYLIARKEAGSTYYSRIGKTNFVYTFQPNDDNFNGYRLNRRVDTSYPVSEYTNLLNATLHLIPVRKGK